MKQGKIWAIFSFSTAIAVVLRLLQTAFFIDNETGFSKSGGTNTAVLAITYGIIVICAVAVFIATTFLSNLQPIHAPDIKTHKGLAVTAFLQAIYGLYTLASVSVDGLRGSNTVYAVLLLLNVVFFCLYGISAFADIKLTPLLSLMPIFSSLFVLISKFLSYNGVANISENILSIFFMCLQTVFYLYHAKIICDTESRRSCRLILPIGCFTAFCGLICTLPQIMLYTVGGSEVLHNSGATELGFLFTAIYAIAFITSLYSKKEAAE